MQLLRTNSDGSDPQLSEVPQQNSVAAQIEYGRAASEGGFITVIGVGLGDPDPTKPTLATLQAFAVNGVTIRQGLLPQNP